MRDAPPADATEALLPGLLWLAFVVVASASLALTAWQVWLATH